MRIGPGKFSCADSNTIKRILNNGSNKIVTPFFLLFYEPNTHNTTELAIIVSKKTARHAKDRNFMKRRMRAFFRQNSWKPGTYVAILRLGIKQCSFASLYVPIATLL